MIKRKFEYRTRGGKRAYVRRWVFSNDPVWGIGGSAPRGARPPARNVCPRCGASSSFEPCKTVEGANVYGSWDYRNWVVLKRGDIKVGSGPRWGKKAMPRKNAGAQEPGRSKDGTAQPPKTAAPQDARRGGKGGPPVASIPISSSNVDRPAHSVTNNPEGLVHYLLSGPHGPVKGKGSKRKGFLKSTREELGTDEIHVIDVRGLENDMKSFKGHTGLDGVVRDRVRRDGAFTEVMERIASAIRSSETRGKSACIYVHCHGGMHRSVAVVEEVHDRYGYRVRHNELKRRLSLPPGEGKRVTVKQLNQVERKLNVLWKRIIATIKLIKGTRYLSRIGVYDHEDIAGWKALNQFSGPKQDEMRLRAELGRDKRIKLARDREICEALHRLRGWMLAKCCREGVSQMMGVVKAECNNARREAFGLAPCHEEAHGVFKQFRSALYLNDRLGPSLNEKGARSPCYAVQRREALCPATKLPRLAQLSMLARSLPEPFPWESAKPTRECLERLCSGDGAGGPAIADHEALTSFGRYAAAWMKRMIRLGEHWVDEDSPLLFKDGTYTTGANWDHYGGRRCVNDGVPERRVAVPNGSTLTWTSAVGGASGYLAEVISKICAEKTFLRATDGALVKLRATLALVPGPGVPNPLAEVNNSIVDQCAQEYADLAKEYAATNEPDLKAVMMEALTETFLGPGAAPPEQPEEWLSQLRGLHRDAPAADKRKLSFFSGPIKGFTETGRFGAALFKRVLADFDDGRIMPFTIPAHLERTYECVFGESTYNGATRARVLAQPEKGWKWRMPTMSPPAATVCGASLRKQMQTLLCRDPRVVGVDGKTEPNLNAFVSGLELSMGDHLRSADLRAATDLIYQSFGQRTIREACGALGGYSDEETDVLCQLAGPMHIETEDGSEATTNGRGLLMGLSPSWVTLCLVNLWAYDRAYMPNAPEEAWRDTNDLVRTCGDDLFAISNPDQDARYDQNIRSSGADINTSKDFSSKIGGVFLEKIYSVNWRTERWAEYDKYGRAIPVEGRVGRVRQADTVVSLGALLGDIPVKTTSLGDVIRFVVAPLRGSRLKSTIQLAMQFHADAISQYRRGTGGLPIQGPSWLPGLRFPHHRGDGFAIHRMPKVLRAVTVAVAHKSLPRGHAVGHEWVHAQEFARNIGKLSLHGMFAVGGETSSAIRAVGSVLDDAPVGMWKYQTKDMANRREDPLPLQERTYRSLLGMADADGWNAGELTYTSLDNATARSIASLSRDQQFTKGKVGKCEMRSVRLLQTAEKLLADARKIVLGTPCARRRWTQLKKSQTSSVNSKKRNRCPLGPVIYQSMCEQIAISRRALLVPTCSFPSGGFDLGMEPEKFGRAAQVHYLDYLKIIKTHTHTHNLTSAKVLRREGPGVEDGNGAAPAEPGETDYPQTRSDQTEEIWQHEGPHGGAPRASDPENTIVPIQRDNQASDGTSHAQPSALSTTDEQAAGSFRAHGEVDSAQ